ncbi:hypothetical protein HZA44_01550 [Candidatus Peregrinibacteria bacterium]|nr:hypothetical protein [Candidatus Peregrinibacteria bacterium]
MMSEPTQTPAAPSINVSEEVRKKYPELVELIKASQSMTNEERQYWVDVLLIMSEDQIQNLRGILANEKKQVDEANQKLKTGMGEEESKVKIHFDEIRYRERKKMLRETEIKSESEEKQNEAALLEEIGKM